MVHGADKLNGRGACARRWIVVLVLAASCATPTSRAAQPTADEIAAFLAGTPLPPGSALAELAAKPGYRRHREAMDRTWSELKRRLLVPLEGWRKEHLGAARSPLVFYPLSGPDLLNATALFPEAERYLLVGLEPAGELVDPRGLEPAAIALELQRLQRALRTIREKNLFRTAEMERDLRGSPYGVAAIGAVFLKRQGQAIVSTRRLGPRPPGVEIVWRRPRGARAQTAHYLQLDLADRSLRASPGPVTALRRGPRFVTLIKAGAYLVGRHFFSDLRSLLLERSSLVVQDDSGIPLRVLEEHGFAVRLFGTYRVIDQFRHRYQPDLHQALRERSEGALPFAFGYGFAAETSNLAVARPATAPEH